MAINRFITFLKRDDVKTFIINSWVMSWPMIVIVFMFFIMQMSGVYISGLIGKEAQATYGFVLQLYFVFIVIANALAVGTVAVTSRLSGSGSQNKCDNNIYSTILFSFGAGMIICLTSFAIIPVLVKYINLPEEIKPLVKKLLTVFTFGLFFHYPFIICNAVLRAIKEVKKSLCCTIIAVSITVALSFYLTLFTKIGFIGIGIAHIIGIFFGCVISLYYLKEHILPFRKFNIKSVIEEIKIGWPAGASQFVWQMGAMFIYFVLSSLPENRVEVLAAFSIGLRIESIAFLPAFAFNLSNAIIIGNLLGEKKYNFAYLSGIITTVMGIAIVCVISLVIVFNASLITPYFTDNSIVLNQAIKYIYVAMIFEPFLAWGVILGGGLSGAGDTKIVLKFTIFSIWLVRVPISYFFAITLGFGAIAVWFALGASLITDALLITYRFRSKKWMFGHSEILETRI